MVSSLDRLEWTPENWRWRLEGNNKLAWEQSEHTNSAVLNNLRDGDHIILDAGCGYGRLSIRILDKCLGTWVVGLDASRAMITEAKGQIDHADFASVLGTLESMPFHSKSFDVIICIGVIMHVKDEIGVLQELARLVKPNGRLFLTFHNRRNPLSIPHTLFEKIRETPVGIRRKFQSLSFYREALENLGFKTSIIHWGFLFPSGAFLIGLTTILRGLNNLFSNLHIEYGYEPLLEAWK